MEVINEKQRKFAINFIMYFFCFISVCIVGISNVFGLEYTDIGNYADITVVLVSTDYGDAPFNVPKGSAYNFTQVLEIDYHVNNFNFEANKNYQLESHLTQQQLTNANYYTVQGLNGEQCLISYDNSYFTGAYPRWAFQCPHATNSITLSIKNSNNQYLWASGQTNIFTWTSVLLKYSNTSLSGNDSSNDSIINNQNQNTQNIINNQNQNTQDIINNQDKNTQDIIDSNKVCSQIDRENIITDNYFLNVAGNLYSSNVYGITDYINVYNSNLKVLSNFTSQSSGATCFYDVNKSLISCTRNDLLGVNTNVILPNNTYYLRSSIQKLQNLPSFELCKNGSQALSDDNKESEKTRKGILGKLKDLFNWLTNDDDADVSSAGDTAGWLPPGPIDSIITLPLTMLNNINLSLNKTCSPLNVNLPYVNKSVVIPCLSDIFNQITGLNSFWSWVGLISSVVILYRYLIELYKYYDRLTTLQANFISDWGSI